MLRSATAPPAMQTNIHRIDVLANATPTKQRTTRCTLCHTVTVTLVALTAALCAYAYMTDVVDIHIHMHKTHSLYVDNTALTTAQQHTDAVVKTNCPLQQPMPIRIQCGISCASLYGPLLTHSYRHLYSNSNDTSWYMLTGDYLDAWQLGQPRVLITDITDHYKIQHTDALTHYVGATGEWYDLSVFNETYAVQYSSILDVKRVHSFQQLDVTTLYIPYYVLSMFTRTRHNMYSLIKPHTYDVSAIMRRKTRFAAYLANSCIGYRDRVYDLISAYKPVDAIGKCKAAPADVAARDADRFARSVDYNFLDHAVELYAPYKFVLVLENHELLGYITEKIVNAMLADAIPIYLGSNDIADHFNSAAFVNVHDYDNWSGVVARIKYLDTHDNAYLSMLKQPWFKDNTLTQWWPDPLQPCNKVFNTLRHMADKYTKG